MRNNLVFSFIAILCTIVATIAVEECGNKCVQKSKCAAFMHLSKQEQESWQLKHRCPSPEDKEISKLFNSPPVAKGDYICCNFGSNYNHPSSPARKSLRSFNNGMDFNMYDPRQEDTYYQPKIHEPRPPKNYFNVNNNPYVTQSPFFPGHWHGHSGNSNLGKQCPITRFPPNPETGCCGREASDTDRITEKPNPPVYNPPLTPTLTQRNHRLSNSYGDVWPSWTPRRSDYNSLHSRVVRSADTPVTVSIGDRIAGGRETELTQFPWTVLLQVTFDYGNRRQAFNCGGSLISSRYVLTAGHCVYDKGGKVIDIDIYLAEYDKRTFPIDCKIVIGVGKKCIRNIVMKAEDFSLHPQYDDEQLNNDIALIRLLGDAPYTDYIRPICLPSIDVDSPDFSNLRLAVAGWGRNGRYRSDIKQSTIVNLVPHDKCKKFYPNLSREQMCAAGYTGEDTCKGDSGGPLMTVYGGKYEVVGVVSGKRADSPCGTSVPSLYTNVYHYRDWIRANMKN